MDTVKPPDKAAGRRCELVPRHLAPPPSCTALTFSPFFPLHLSSVLGEKASDGPIHNDKASAAGGAGCLPVAAPPAQEDGGCDSGVNSRPKKGIIFEICSEDGFHIRSETIEGT